MQQRLKKYSRDQNTFAAVASRQITPTSLNVIATIHDYKIIPTSLLVRLVPGHEKSTHRHLKHLYHKQLVNRFAFMRGKNPSEFYYYLDNPSALELLVANNVDRESLEFEEVRRNREKRYCDMNDPKRIEEMQGRLLFLKHEIMISRFHAMLELACASSNEVELSDFRQGPGLWNTVSVPRLTYRNGQWVELDETEDLPHRPDAFFTLSFPQGEREDLHFFYEADRHRTDTNKFNRKLRAHFYFVAKQKRHREIYGINRIRAVLTETVDDEWAETLRQAANHTVVSGSKASPLFWFTTSRLFTEEQVVQQGTRRRSLPAHLRQPEIVIRKIWASPVNDQLHSLLE
jgi:Replication-relaxation